MTVNPLVAARVDQPADAWSGVWIAEDIELIGQGVRNGSWIDTGLGVVGAGLDGLAMVSDPVGVLLQYGVAWIIEHVRPLTQALDWLAGDPGQIAGHAQTWRNVAASLQSSAEEAARAVCWDVADWGGSAGPAYRDWAGQQHAALGALGKAAETMAAITEGAGMLVAAVRMLVRDAIATCVSRLITYAAEEAGTLGLATPLVVEQVSTLVASWAAKIARWLKGLLSSLRRLEPVVRKLGEYIDKLKQLLGRLRNGGRYGGYTGKERDGLTRGEDHAVDVPDHFTVSDLDSVADHLARLDHSPANDAMISRIRNKLVLGEELSEGEQNFMKHEMVEKSLMDNGMSYDDAHKVALTTHPPGKNYDPDVIDEYAHLFNNWWRKQWGLEPR